MWYERDRNRAWWRPRRATKQKLARPLPEFCRVATLNLQNAGRTSGKDAKILDAVAFQKTHRIDILFVQELKEGKSRITTKVLKWGYRLVACGQVGIVLSPQMYWRKEAEFKRGDRCIGVVIEGCAYCSMYQPYHEKTVEGRAVVEAFFDEREKFMGTIHRKKIRRKVLGGDWNAAAGYLDAATAAENEGVLGRYTLGREAGWAFKENVSFARGRYLSIADSHRNMPRRGTWHPAIGPVNNWKELDYFMVGREMMGDVGRMTSLPTGVLTDHRAKVMLVRFREARGRRAERRRNEIRAAEERRKRVETRTLHRRPEVAQAYRLKVEETVAGKFDERGLGGPAPAGAGEAADFRRERWAAASEAMREAGMEVMGPTTRSKAGEWVTLAETEQHQREMAGLLEERRALVGADPAAKRRCQARIDECRKTWRDRKDRLYAEWVDEQARKAAEATARGDTAKAYEHMSNMNDITPAEINRNTPDFDINDVKQHFERIGNKPFEEPVEFLQRADDVVPQRPVKASLGDTPTNEQIMEQVWKRVRPGATPGDDGIQVQLLKYGGPAVQECFCELVKWCWRRPADQPADWARVKLVAIWKKKFPQEDLDNHRAVALINLGSKVIEGIAHHRIYNYLEFDVGYFEHEQSGFRAGRSTDDLSLIVRLLMEHGAISGRMQLLLRIALLLIDFKKAFPSVVRKICYHILRRAGVDPRLVAVLEHVHEASEFYVSFQGEKSAVFKNTRGFREGGGSSGLGFNVVVNIIIILINQECSGVEFEFDADFATPLNKRARRMEGGDRVGCQVFADDTTLAQLLCALDANMEKVKWIAEMARMEIHPGKTERVVARKKGGPPEEHPDHPEPHDPTDPTKRFLQQKAKIVGGIVEDDGSLWEEHELRLGKAKKQFSKWRWICEKLGCGGESPRLTVEQFGNLLSVNVVTALVFNPMRPFWIPQQREYQLFLNRVVRFAAGWTLDEVRRSSEVNMADLRVAVGIPHVQVTIERKQLQYFWRIMNSDRNTMAKKLLFGRFGKATASPPTARYFHDLLKRAVGEDYLQVVNSQDEFHQRIGNYLADLQAERDARASVAGGKHKSTRSVRFRKVTQARDWDAFADRLERFENGNPDGVVGHVHECSACKLRLLVVDDEPETAQAVRTHKRDCGANFNPAEFDAHRMRKIKRYWECKVCGQRHVRQSDAYAHAQWHAQGH
eukprot:gene62-78_t